MNGTYLQKNKDYKNPGQLIRLQKQARISANCLEEI